MEFAPGGNSRPDQQQTRSRRVFCWCAFWGVPPEFRGFGFATRVPNHILFNKPHGVLCQFSPQAGRKTLADFIDLPGVYAAGRLDADSEGLLLLTDDGRLQARITDPRRSLAKTYWAQVEGEADAAALARLQNGVDIGDVVTRPCQARIITEPDELWPRNPPIRYRAAIPTSWIELVLHEGKNRQVRRMTARVGFPTLRLIRSAIGPWRIDGLAPGRWRCLELDAMYDLPGRSDRK